MLSPDLNTESESHLITDAGSELHTVGAEKQKVKSILASGMSRSGVADEWSMM